MEPVLRISGHGAITLTLTGLTSGQATALHEVVRSLSSGTGIKCAAFPFLDYNESSPSCLSPDLVLTGTPDQLKRFLRACGAHDDISGNLSQKMDSLLDNYLCSDYKITFREGFLELGSRTHVMGILNVTPDSFSDGGLYANAERAFAHAREMATAGADIIDIGGESTRPGAEPLSEAEELRRIIPIIERVATELAVPVSVDTYKSSVARRALEAGASIVNDISGLRFSPDMARIAGDYGAAVVIMHIKGTPRDMQQNPVYDDVVDEVMSFLAEGIAIAVNAGVEREKILIDPGIGFGKTVEHNLTLLNRLDEFRGLGRPIVLGTSRKKFIGASIGIPVPEQRDDGTAATVALGIERGASIVRVHDVARMVRVARMTDAVLRASS